MWSCVNIHCFSFLPIIQTSMNALKGLTSVHTTARTLLEATHVAVGQDIGWPLMGALAMVSVSVEFLQRLAILAFEILSLSHSQLFIHN